MEGYEYMRKITLCNTSADDSVKSIKECTDIRRLYSSLGYECMREVPRATVVTALKRKIKRMEAHMEAKNDYQLKPD